MITAETIERIVRFNGDGLPVVSLYSPVGAGAGRRDLRARASSLLHQIKPLAKDGSLGHEARMSLRTDIERIEKAVAEEHWPPGAIAIFSCAGRDLHEEVPLPRRVRDRVVVDATRKPNYAAGLAEGRVRNKADELSKRHYRRVAEVLDELFRTDQYDLLIVGGHDYELPQFLDFLPRDLRDRVAGTFSVDPATAPAAEIRAAAAAIMERYERDEEQRLVSVFEKAATSQFAALGLASCLWAGTVAAIQTLLVQEGVPAPGVVCDESGWLALAGDACPLCGKPARHAPDVIDELAQAVIDEGGSIKHVEAGTKLVDHVVAAHLRFPLPPASPAP
jgi:peptide chain release factor subunit 1